MTSIATYAAGRLAELADPEKARRMAAYMKTSDPFYGVQKPGRGIVMREILERFPAVAADEHERGVHELWAGSHREEKYLALEYAAAYPAFIRFDAMPLYRRLIVEGAWWDFVDHVATRCVGEVWRLERARTTPLLGEWIDDDNMWLRRTAIIGQLKHRADTDERILFDFCDRRAHEKEFFIRKAIGWALREYAKTAPAAVTDYLISRRNRLSGLSFREGAKHLDIR